LPKSVVLLNKVIDLWWIVIAMVVRAFFIFTCIV